MRDRKGRFSSNAIDNRAHKLGWHGVLRVTRFTLHQALFGGSSCVHLLMDEYKRFSALQASSLQRRRKFNLVLL